MILKRNNPSDARDYFANKVEFTTGPIELDRARREGDRVTVVDVRAPADFAREHIPGSINLPQDRWATLEGLTREGLVVVVCYSEVCHLAARAAVEFASNGLSVMELDGGFKAWKEHDLPVESGAYHSAAE